MTHRKKPAEAIQGAFTRNGFSLVEFDRRPLDPYPLRAFVLNWSPDLTLVQVFDTHSYQLNGYAVLRNITPQAEWEGQESYRVKDITLLEFGGTYESLLSTFVTPIPTERGRT